MNKKRDTLTMMFSYTQLYLEQRIKDAVNEDDRTAYQAELGEAKALFIELFEKAHKGII